jgi:hypothetical protein
MEILRDGTSLCAPSPHHMARSEGGIASCFADQEATVFPFFDSVRKPRDIDQALRSLDRSSKKVDEIGAATKVLRRVRSAEA